jgi:hypothetical protein
MTGLMRFGKGERLWLCIASPLTLIASQSDLSPHLRGEVSRPAQNIRRRSIRYVRAALVSRDHFRRIESPRPP